ADGRSHDRRQRLLGQRFTPALRPRRGAASGPRDPKAERQGPGASWNRRRSDHRSGRGARPRRAPRTRGPSAPARALPLTRKKGLRIRGLQPVERPLHALLDLADALVGADALDLLLELPDLLVALERLDLPLELRDLSAPLRLLPAH